MSAVGGSGRQRRMSRRLSLMLQFARQPAAVPNTHRSSDDVPGNSSGSRSPQWRAPSSTMAAVAAAAASAAAVRTPVAAAGAAAAGTAGGAAASARRPRHDGRQQRKPCVWQQHQRPCSSASGSGWRQQQRWRWPHWCCVGAAGSTPDADPSTQWFRASMTDRLCQLVRLVAGHCAVSSGCIGRARICGVGFACICCATSCQAVGVHEASVWVFYGLWLPMAGNVIL
ncbi:hypothetical protein COO60DRAFT_1122565 [Scenedesmus sp. NREL 46B-D3]|nr:hypothetical protein COO60DRAFT_1122565 [Scenedesmus sp. NREL 46B-D3]